MREHVMTMADFNRNPSRAKREAADRPVIITERGANAFVLMRYDDYQSSVKPKRTLLDLADTRAEADSAFEPSRFEFEPNEIDW